MKLQGRGEKSRFGVDEFWEIRRGGWIASIHANQNSIKQLGTRTVEIDLSGLVVTPSSDGLLEIKRALLHDVTSKQWL